MAVNNIAQWITRKDFESLSAQLQAPLPFYGQNRFMLLRDPRDIRAYVTRFVRTLHANGITHVAVQDVTLEDSTPSRCLAVVVWKLSYAADPEPGYKRARYVFCRGPVGGLPQIEMIESLDVSLQDLCLDSSQTQA